MIREFKKPKDIEEAFHLFDEFFEVFQNKNTGLDDDITQRSNNIAKKAGTAYEKKSLNDMVIELEKLHTLIDEMPVIDEKYDPIKAKKRLYQKHRGKFLKIQKWSEEGLIPWEELVLKIQEIPETRKGCYQRFASLVRHARSRDLDPNDAKEIEPLGEKIEKHCVALNFKEAAKLMGNVVRIVDECPSKENYREYEPRDVDIEKLFAKVLEMRKKYSK